jgi:hypothetical protein
MFNSLIEEFDASGAASATQVSNSSFSGARQGMAVRGSSGDIFYAVSTSTSENIQVLSGTLSTAPDVTTTAASAITATTATLNGSVNPDAVGLTECKFEYGKSTAYGSTVPCAESTGSIGSGTNPVAVHADISGLDLGGAVYHFRLVAKNAEAPAVNGSDLSFATKGPEITDTWAEDVTVTEALLKAKINPKGLATTYRFEYGQTAAYGNESEELNVGSDSSAHKVLLSLEGLASGTEYHYRVVATNAAAENAGPDRTIRTFRPFSAETDCPNQANRYGAGANLPDCRAYEMVSPVDKGNGDICVLNSAEYSAPAKITKSTRAGDKLTYSSATSFGGALSAPYTSQYIAQRLPGQGWDTHSINELRATPIVGGLSQFFESYGAFSDDLCYGWMASYDEPTLGEGALAGYQNLYRRSDRFCGAERFQALAPIVTPAAPPTTGSFGFFLVNILRGVSADGSHTIFLSNAKIAPEGTQNPGAYGPVQLYDPAPLAAGVAPASPARSQGTASGSSGLPAASRTRRCTFGSAAPKRWRSLRRAKRWRERRTRSSGAPQPTAPAPSTPRAMVPTPISSPSTLTRKQPNRSPTAASPVSPG